MQGCQFPEWRRVVGVADDLDVLQQEELLDRWERLDHTSSFPQKVGRRITEPEEEKMVWLVPQAGLEGH